MLIVFFKFQIRNKIKTNYVVKTWLQLVLDFNSTI